jgi:hypothetical protein
MTAPAFSRNPALLALGDEAEATASRFLDGPFSTPFYRSLHLLCDHSRSYRSTSDYGLIACTPVPIFTA